MVVVEAGLPTKRKETIVDLVIGRKSWGSMRQAQPARGTSRTPLPSSGRSPGSRALPRSVSAGRRRLALKVAGGFGQAALHWPSRPSYFGHALPISPELTPLDTKDDPPDPREACPPWHAAPRALY
jgi:hypothetical protein